MSVSLLKAPALRERIGFKTAYIYRLVRNGLLMPPVKVGARAVAWPSDEVDRWVAARIRGAADGELRQLVADLVAARTTAGTSTEAQS